MDSKTIENSDVSTADNPSNYPSVIAEGIVIDWMHHYLLLLLIQLQQEEKMMPDGRDVDWMEG